MVTRVAPLAAVLLAGCAWAFTPPTVEVADVRLASMSFTGGALSVRLRIQNPNRYALESEDFTYGLTYAEGEGPDARWTTLSSGQVADTIRVPAHETQEVTVEVPFDLGAVASALARLQRNGGLEYRFTGQILARTPLGRRRIPIDQRGFFRP